jgi:SAM-dependent methyltransferase
LSLVRDILGKQDLSSVRWLDVGCGTRLTQVLLEGGVALAEYRGVESSRELADWLSENVASPGLSHAHFDARHPVYNPGGCPLSEFERLPAPTRHFDLITLFSVFTHLDPRDFSALLGLLQQHLKPGGQLIFSAFINETTTGGHGLIDGIVRTLQSHPERMAGKLSGNQPGIVPGFVDAHPEQPLLWALYSREYALSLIEDSGWECHGCYPPREYVQHVFNCRLP